MKISKILFILIFSVSSFFLFKIMEFELLNQAINNNFQAIIFSATLTVSIFQPKYRSKLLYTAFFLLSVMVGFYLINQMALSNSFASIGIGMLFLILLSYLPQLIKKGYVENL